MIYFLAFFPAIRSTLCDVPEEHYLIKFRIFQDTHMKTLSNNFFKCCELKKSVIMTDVTLYTRLLMNIYLGPEQISLLRPVLNDFILACQRVQNYDLEKERVSKLVRHKTICSSVKNYKSDTYNKEFNSQSNRLKIKLKNICSQLGNVSKFIDLEIISVELENGYPLCYTHQRISEKYDCEISSHSCSGKCHEELRAVSQRSIHLPSYTLPSVKITSSEKTTNAKNKRPKRELTAYERILANSMEMLDKRTTIDDEKKSVKKITDKKSMAVSVHYSYPKESHSSRIQNSLKISDNLKTIPEILETQKAKHSAQEQEVQFLPAGLSTADTEESIQSSLLKDDNDESDVRIHKKDSDAITSCETEISKQEIPQYDSPEGINSCSQDEPSIKKTQYQYSSPSSGMSADESNSQQTIQTTENSPVSDTKPMKYQLSESLTQQLNSIKESESGDQNLRVKENSQSQILFDSTSKYVLDQRTKTKYETRDVTTSHLENLTEIQTSEESNINLELMSVLQPSNQEKSVTDINGSSASSFNSRQSTVHSSKEEERETKGVQQSHKSEKSNFQHEYPEIETPDRKILHQKRKGSSQKSTLSSRKSVVHSNREEANGNELRPQSPKPISDRTLSSENLFFKNESFESSLSGEKYFLEIPDKQSQKSRSSSRNSEIENKESVAGESKSDTQTPSSSVIYDNSSKIPRDQSDVERNHLLTKDGAKVQAIDQKNEFNRFLILSDSFLELEEECAEASELSLSSRPSPYDTQTVIVSYPGSEYSDKFVIPLVEIKKLNILQTLASSSSLSSEEEGSIEPKIKKTVVHPLYPAKISETQIKEGEDGSLLSEFPKAHSEHLSDKNICDRVSDGDFNLDDAIASEPPRVMVIPSPDGSLNSRITLETPPKILPIQTVEDINVPSTEIHIFDEIEQKSSEIFFVNNDQKMEGKDGMTKGKQQDSVSEGSKSASEHRQSKSPKTFYNKKTTVHEKPVKSSMNSQSSSTEVRSSYPSKSDIGGDVCENSSNKSAEDSVYNSETPKTDGDKDDLIKKILIENENSKKDFVFKGTLLLDFFLGVSDVNSPPILDKINKVVTKTIQKIVPGGKTSYIQPKSKNKSEKTRKNCCNCNSRKSDGKSSHDEDCSISPDDAKQISGKEKLLQCPVSSKRAIPQTVASVQPEQRLLS